MQKEVKLLNTQKQYGAFSSEVKSLGSFHSRENIKYCPGVFFITKHIVLSAEDFEKLGEDISPEYPFLKANEMHMSADPGGQFFCLLVTAQGRNEGLLLAKEEDDLYVGYAPDYRRIELKDVPVERFRLDEPTACQENAVFYHKPRRKEDLCPAELGNHKAERQTAFKVERVVVLEEEAYEHFKEDMSADYPFLFVSSPKMWFEPGDNCFHCVLVRGQGSRDGILVESEGYASARYAAAVPDCDRLRLVGVPVQYERNTQETGGLDRKEQGDAR